MSCPYMAAFGSKDVTGKMNRGDQMESYGSDYLDMGFSLKKSGLKTFPMLLIIESPNGVMPASFLVLFNIVVHAHYCQMQCAFLFSLISLFFPPSSKSQKKRAGSLSSVQYVAWL